MFFKVVDMQVKWYKEDMVSLKNANDKIIEFCEYYISSTSKKYNIRKTRKILEKLLIISELLKNVDNEL